MAEAQTKSPPLANLVRSGDAQTEAVAITDFIFMANDVSNAYLVTTSDGDVVINTGMPDGAERTQALFAPHRTGPLRAVATGAVLLVQGRRLRRASPAEAQHQQAEGKRKAPAPLEIRLHVQCARYAKGVSAMCALPAATPISASSR